MKTPDDTVKEMRDFIYAVFNQHEDCVFLHFNSDIIQRLSEEDLTTVYEIYKSNIIQDDIEYNAEVLRNIAFYLEYVRRDYEGSKIWYQKLAERGDTDAMFRLAHLYSNSWQGLNPNYEKALELMKESAYGGNAQAMDYMGTIYGTNFIGPDFGVKKDNFLSVEWFKKSYLQDGNWSAAFSLAHAYRAGSGIKQDQEKYEILMRCVGCKERIFDRHEARLILAESNEERIAYCKEHKIKAETIFDTWPRAAKVLYEAKIAKLKNKINYTPGNKGYLECEAEFYSLIPN